MKRPLPKNEYRDGTIDVDLDGISIPSRPVALPHSPRSLAEDIDWLLNGEDPNAPAEDPNDPQLELSAVLAELLRRQRAQESLAEYARAIEIPGGPANEDSETEQFKTIESAITKHHLLLLREAQACIEKSNGRVMFFLPPGSAKSTYLSAVTPAWCMSKWPDYRVILASYASDLAEKHSRKARNICRQEKHISIWDDRPTLNQDQRAVGEWALSNKSEFMAAGLQAGITGNRADLLIIDDPVKNREDADSPTIQKKTQEEFRDSAMSRLKPNASIILIQTRWNENDLAGSLLPEDYKGESGDVLCRDGQVWKIFNIPAEAERADDPLARAPGEFLWPEWFSTEHWMIRKNDPQGQRTWSSLYQQRPTAGEGLEFKRDWFRFYDPSLPKGSPRRSDGLPVSLPAHLTIYASCDFATKEDKGDFTELCIFGIDEHHNLYVLDWWYGQKTSDVYIAQMMAMMRYWKPMKWFHEGGPIGEAITPAIVKGMRENKLFSTVLVSMPSIKNKAVKLTSLQARIASGTVYFPVGKPWSGRAIDQLCGFPAARYDDAADTCGLMGRSIDELANPYVPSEQSRPQLKPFTVAWLEHSDTDERRRTRYF